MKGLIVNEAVCVSDITAPYSSTQQVCFYVTLRRMLFIARAILTRREFVINTQRERNVSRNPR